MSARRAVAAAVADVACVAVFAAAGRDSHGEGVDLVGTAHTAGPFLGGLVVGWAAARAWRRPLSASRTGPVVWVATVAGGMLLRRATGSGTAPSFVVVATVFLGATLVGWRAIAALVARRRSVPGAGRRSLP